MLILVSFLGGLRGDDTLKLELGETVAYIDESENHRKHKNVVLPLRKRFKETSGEGFHFVAVSAKTNSGLCIGP